MVPTLERRRHHPAPRPADGGWPRALWPRPRVRRPVDGARLLVVGGVLVLLVLLAAVDPDLVLTTRNLVHPVPPGLPRAVFSGVNVAASVAVLGVLLGVAVDAVRRRPFALVSALLAAVAGLLLGLAGGALAGLVGGEAVGTALVGPPHDSAGLAVAAAVAAVVGADRQRRRWMGPVRASLAVAVVCALALGTLSVPGAVYALVVGTAAGLAVRVVLGVVPARPPDEVVRTAVARAGWPVRRLEPVEEVAGQARYAGTGPSGEELRITVVDPDRRGVTLARRAWRLVRLRTAAVGRPALSLRGELERRALTARLAESAGIVAPRSLALLSAARALVLVERPVAGTPLREAEIPAATRAAADAWGALRRLHDVGVAHGGITADGILLPPGGGVAFADLSAAQPAATGLQRELDAVALLVATATRLGAEEALGVFRPEDGAAPAAPARLAALLQPLALPPALRRAVRGTPVLADLRTAVAGSGGGGSVASPRLERLRPRTVVMVAAATLAAHILATQLSEVGIGDALRTAAPGWLAVAVLGSAVTYVGSAMGLQAFVPAPLRPGRTALVQLASSWLTLVTPPAVGHLGLNIRYLQRAGLPTAVATASVAVKETVTVAVTVPLLLLCGWASGVSASRLALLPQGNVLVVLLVATGILALVAAVPASRRVLRRRLEPLVRRTVPQLLAAVSHPRRLALGVAGVLLLDGGYVLALDASLRAFSVSLALPALVVVYLAGATLGSVAPTPGGLGAVEAALVGGLTATGVPLAQALTAVLVFRAATFWLPAPLGWGAFVALQRRGRI